MALTVPRDIIPSPDLDQVREALAALIGPGERFEIRGLPSRRSYVGTSIDAACNHVRSCAADGGVFWIMNPLRHDLDHAASDCDVISRRWLLIDIDPARPSEDAPATEAERTAARKTADLVAYHLRVCDWPEPIVVDSGNGVQLLYRVDLPATELSRQLVRGVLVSLSRLYTTDAAGVDTTVHNASRLARLPGTWNRKGEQTAARPYRMATIIDRPLEARVVTAEQLQEVAGSTQPEPTTDRPAPAPAPIVPTGGGLRVPATLPTGADVAWYRKALENECAKVMLAPNGHRHDALKNASVTLAGHLHAGAYSEPELRAGLMTAAQRAGLPEREAADLIEWGVTTGVASPLPRPAKLDAPEVRPAKKVKAAPLDPESIPDGLSGKPLVIRASDILPKKVEWLWPGRVPIGKLTTFAGQGGVGKTMVLCDMAARITTGAMWPHSGGDRADVGDVLFISGEDDPDDTLVPRLMEAGADRSRVCFLSDHAMSTFHLSLVKFLEEIMDQTGPRVRLVVIDPPTSYLQGVDDHKNAELRGVLTPLSVMAARRRVAIVFNTHLNKAVNNFNAASRIMGSAAWSNAVRGTSLFVRDPDVKGQVFFAPDKTNLSAPIPALIYRIVAGEAGPRVEWIGASDMTADDALAGAKAKPRRVHAAEWLAEQFAVQREHLSNDLYREAKEAGLSRGAVWEAKQALPIRAKKISPQDGSPVYWAWVAEDGWPPAPVS